MRIRFSSLLFLLMLLATGCTTNYYISGYTLHQRGQYIGAIENYDQFIAKTKDGAMKTQVLSKRSEAYYSLGKNTMSRENYQLAIRFFYLANTYAADEKIADCYLHLADIEFAEGNVESTLRYYNYIIANYDQLPIISQVVFRRMQLNHQNYKVKELIWSDFLLLYDRYNDWDYIKKAIPIIDLYILDFVEEILSRREEYGDEDTIKMLYSLNYYPHSYGSNISDEIGLIYYSLGEEVEEKENFVAAVKFYNLAGDYNESLLSKIDEKLQQIVYKIIRQGENLLDKREISAAQMLFESTFQIIPNHPEAQKYIERAENLKNRIQRAQELYNKGLQAEKEEKYNQALSYFNQSYEIDKQKTTEEKIFMIGNIIEIERDHIGFAKKIISEHNNRAIIRNIEGIVEQLRQKDGNSVSVSDWRIMLSTGNHRYEVRYDIMGVSKSYYFIWQVNLLTRSITPLNNQSQQIME